MRPIVQLPGLVDDDDLGRTAFRRPYWQLLTRTSLSDMLCADV